MEDKDRKCYLDRIMRISPRVRMEMGKVIWITIFFVLINIFLVLHNEVILNSRFSLGPSDAYSFKIHLISNIIAGFCSGILGGALLVFVNSRLFRKRSFGSAMTITAVGFVMVFFLVTVVTFFPNHTRAIDVNGSIVDKLWALIEYSVDQTVLVYFIFWGIITMLTMFFLQVSDKFGPGILSKFLRGKYHSPREEERIFMFLDMRSSTTIAERLGHTRYFELISSVFAELTDTILNNEGEIYQYVGDEIIISWPLEKGRAGAKCIKCFMGVQKRLKELGPDYEAKFGVRPEMKAGLHYGPVIAGEVGVIKKDIVYSGDVLNTCARIQDQCNKYKVDFLISKETYDILTGAEQYELVPLGNIALRGREQTVYLNTIRSIEIVQ